MNLFGMIILVKIHGSGFIKRGLPLILFERYISSKWIGFIESRLLWRVVRVTIQWLTQLVLIYPDHYFWPI